MITCHPEAWKTDLTTYQHYPMPSMYNKFGLIVKACEICVRKINMKDRLYPPRIPIDYKDMPYGFDRFKYLLVATCDITNFVIAIQQKKIDVEVDSEAQIHRIICFWPSKTANNGQRHNFCRKSSIVHSECYQMYSNIINPSNHRYLIQNIRNVIKNIPQEKVLGGQYLQHVKHIPWINLHENQQMYFHPKVVTNKHIFPYDNK